MDIDVEALRLLLIGKNIEEARKQMKDNDIIIRQIEKDGISQPRKFDFRQDRVNVSTVNNIIDNIISIG